MLWDAYIHTQGQEILSQISQAEEEEEDEDDMNNVSRSLIRDQ